MSTTLIRRLTTLIALALFSTFLIIPAQSSTVAAAPEHAASTQACKGFTNTMTYGQITVRQIMDAGIPIPDAAKNFLDQIVITEPVAYAQLKGSWCFDNMRVTSYDVRPLEAYPTGYGTGLFFKVTPVATGAVYWEEYGNGATRYRIAQSRADVYLNNPAEITLKIPATDIGIKIPPGQYLMYTMRTDTLLTGFGNATCAGTNFAPCNVVTY
ncbi:MAG: hypothetical protein AAGF95_16850 [Chloroflexota bacterium]